MIGIVVKYHKKKEVVYISNEKIPANNKVSYLLEKCPKIDEHTISSIPLVPEYVKAIENFDESEINSQTLYKIIREAYLEILMDGKKYRIATNIIKNISKSVMDDSLAWQEGVPARLLKQFEITEKLNKKNELKFLEKAGDFFYLKDVLNLKLSSLNSMFSYEEFIDAFRKHGAISSDKEAFEVFKSVFYPMIRSGIKNNSEQKHKYYQLRNVLRDFSTIIFGDVDAWHEDYNNFYNT